MKKILIALAVVLVVCVAGLLVTAVDQLAGFANRFHPLAGQITFWILVSAIAGAALFILFEYCRLPVTLALPADASPDEQRRYLSLLRRRLKSNPRFKQQSLETIDEIQSALGSLQLEADTIIRRTAATVFISTAAMQNGRLDGVVVLLTQTRMIWQIARLYVQRPSARDLIYLYGNVAGTALLASNLEDIDLSDVFAPVTASMAPAAFSAIPGAAGISHFIVRCVSNGAANAFLTLRVGEVARRYCEAIAPTSRREIRI
ncbi:MAG: YcjF family protein, partial [Verrucomicrobiaceae bacterium]|nr:YcjF family protein [Verrucomicrobiaceae bacterium]